MGKIEGMVGVGVSSLKNKGKSEFFGGGLGGCVQETRLLTDPAKCKLYFFFQISFATSLYSSYMFLLLLLCHVHTAQNDLTKVLNEASALLFFPVAFSRGGGHLDARGRIEAGEEEGA